MAALACGGDTDRSGRRVVMLAGNDAVADSRVIKEAEAVAAAGYETSVLCFQSERCARDTERAGVRYRRVPPLPRAAGQNATPPATKDPALCASLAPQGGFASPPPSSRHAMPAPATAEEATESSRPQTAPPAAAKLPDVPAAAAGGSIEEPATDFRRVARRDRRLFRAIFRRVRRLFRATLQRIRKLVNEQYRRLSRFLRTAAARVQSFCRRLVRSTGLRVKRVRGYWRRAADRARRRQLQARRYSGAEYRDTMLEPLVALQPDVVHAHDLVTLATAVAAKQRLGCRIVYDAHELETERNANYPPWVWRLIRRTERRLIPDCDHVITVSRRIAAHLAKLYGIARPTVIYNAPQTLGSVTTPPAPGRGLRHHLGLGGEAKILVYVGSITVGRGLPVALAAIARLPEHFHLALVGPVRPATGKELEGLRDSLGVAARVHFVPPVAPEEVVPFIRDADLSLSLIEDVCLSYRYCMPNKLFESVFAGVPVLASDLPEMADFLRETGAGRVVPLADLKAVVRVVLEMCGGAPVQIDAERRHTLEAKWGWAAQAARLQELYADLLPRRGLGEMPVAQREIETTVKAEALANSASTHEPGSALHTRQLAEAARGRY